jgi:putative sterol carrier protein
MRALRVLAGLGILSGVIAAAPQSKHPLAGKWNIEYERGRRMTDGESQSIMGKALLEITVKGDSLVGTLTMEPAAEGRSAPPPQALAGTGSGNAASLKSTAESRINMNGEERVVNITMTWDLKADGDNLTGSMARAMAGMAAAMTPAPVKGTRVK